MTSFLKHSFLGLCASCAVFADAALAVDHPPLNPREKAVVVYDVGTPAAKDAQAANVHRVKVYFGKNGDALRIEQMGGVHATILDKVGQRVVLLDSAKKLYLPLKPRNGLRSPFLLDLSMNFIPAGSKTVAGAPCEEWKIDSKYGRGAACVTKDGLILEEEGVDSDGKHGNLRAVSVSKENFSDDLFQAPKDYHRWVPVLSTGAPPNAANGEGAAAH